MYLLHSAAAREPVQHSLLATPTFGSILHKLPTCHSVILAAIVFMIQLKVESYVEVEMGFK
jgi:hypothetical protein